MQVFRNTLLACLLVLPQIAIGESAPSIAGIVSGPGDELLANVPIQLTHTETGAVARIRTSTEGGYELFELVSGDGAREVLGKLCPVDLSAEAFVPGQFRRTRMAQVAAAFWLDQDGSFHIVCFRSVADYMFSLLSTAAQPQSEVGVY